MHGNRCEARTHTSRESTVSQYYPCSEACLKAILFSQVAKLGKIPLRCIPEWLKKHPCPTDLAKNLIVSPTLREIRLNGALDELSLEMDLSRGESFPGSHSFWVQGEP